MKFCFLLFSVHTSRMASDHIKDRVDNIIKSAEDKRLYRGLELHNGMKVYCLGMNLSV